MEQESIPPPPHVLIFPFFVQGHINSMLKLAELLCLSGFHVTFLNSVNNHRRLLRYTDLQSRFSRFPGSLRLETITDLTFIDFLDLNDMITGIKTNVDPAFRELLLSDHLKSDDIPPITCIIADGILGFTIDIGEELGIPVISFRTVSSCCYWIYFCIPQLIESGELPFNDDDDLDRRVTSVTEMEGFLRRRDLPSFCRAKELTDPELQFVEFETFNSTRASAHILNTFEDLEAPILTQIRSYCPNLYTLGPLHALLRSRSKDYSPNASNGLWEEDRSCMTWLDSQPEKSVVYVSFGSLAKVSRAELLEFWFGLVNSGQRFLWVKRPRGKEDEEEEEEEEILVEGTRERGFIVGWGPQEEVLLHPAIGGFLTHSGWNSTLESLAAGVPMICWPQFADQMINSRYVSEVWRVGMDMKDTCDRSMVERLVRDMMEDGDTRKELMKSTAKMAVMAKKTVSEGGSSYVNFDALVDRIRELMSSKALHENVDSGRLPENDN